jgi:predicted porin
MKKHLLALAALATVSGVAAAQSVTVYGILDTGIYSTNTSGSTNKKQSQVVSGTWLPSLWGITGSEDLGGGMKATFNLQSNLDTDTGATSGFGRYATVGLAGAYGQVDLGNQIDNIFLQSFLNGVVPTHTNSLAVNGLLAYNATGTNDNNVLGAFIKNAVGYTSPTINGFTVKAQFAQGETAGHSSYNTIYNGLVTYAGNGFSLSAGIEDQKTAGGLKGLKYGLLGAKTSFAGLDFAAQLNTWKNDNSSTRVDASGYELGVAKKFGAATVAINFESFKDDVANTDPKIVSLKAKYDLSKRTAVWGLVSNYNKDAAGAIKQGYNLSTTGATKTATGFGVGVTHSF